VPYAAARKNYYSMTAHRLAQLSGMGIELARVALEGQLLAEARDVNGLSLAVRASAYYSQMAFPVVKVLSDSQARGAAPWQESHLHLATGVIQLRDTAVQVGRESHGFYVEGGIQNCL